MPSKRRIVKSIMDTATSVKSVFSEEAKQLKNFLLELESEQESQVLLKEIEKYLFSSENRWRLKTDDISRFLTYLGRFLLGDTESKGFLYYCFQVKQSCHYFCCLFLETLSKMLDSSFNPNSDNFRQFICCLPLAKLKQLGIGAHIETSGFKKCQQHSFDLIWLLEKQSPRIAFTALFISAKMKARYNEWKSKRALLCSDEQVCRKESPCNARMQSANRVFGQPLEASDAERKQSLFLAEAEYELHGEQVNQDDVSVKVNVDNYDMALLRCSFNAESHDIDSRPTEADSASTSVVQTSGVQQSSNQNTQDETAFRNLIKTHLQTSSNSTTELVAIQQKDSKTQVRISHRNTIYVLNLKKSQTTQFRPTMNNALYHLNFEAVEGDSTSIDEVSNETSFDMKVNSGRKLSFSCNGHDTSTAEKCCGSTVSTLAGSDNFLPSSQLREVHCCMEGKLSFSVEPLTKFSKYGSKTFTMSLFLLAKDQTTRAFIRAMPDMKQVLKNAFFQAFTMLSQD